MENLRGYQDMESATDAKIMLMPIMHSLRIEECIYNYWLL